MKKKPKTLFSIREFGGPDLEARLLAMLNTGISNEAKARRLAKMIDREKKDHVKKGMITACTLVDNIYAGNSNHKYLIGECVLAKLNVLRRKKPRINHKRIPVISRGGIHYFNTAQ